MRYCSYKVAVSDLEPKENEMDKEMEAAFAARMEEIKALLVEMQERVDLVASKPNRNWGHVGDLGYFREGLKDLLGHNG
jgi:hypothetical protein